MKKLVFSITLIASQVCFAWTSLIPSLEKKCQFKKITLHGEEAYMRRCVKSFGRNNSVEVVTDNTKESSVIPCGLEMYDLQEAEKHREQQRPEFLYTLNLLKNSPLSQQCESVSGLEQMRSENESIFQCVLSRLEQQDLEARLDLITDQKGVSFSLDPSEEEEDDTWQDEERSRLTQSLENINSYLNTKCNFFSDDDLNQFENKVFTSLECEDHKDDIQSLKNHITEMNNLIYRRASERTQCYLRQTVKIDE